MSDPQEAATPSDPHSAEAEEREAWAAFVAGHASRDAEVAELKAKIAELTQEVQDADSAIAEAIVRGW